MSPTNVLSLQEMGPSWWKSVSRRGFQGSSRTSLPGVQCEETLPKQTELPLLPTMTILLLPGILLKSAAGDGTQELLQRNSLVSSSHLRQLITTIDSSSRKSGALFWPLQAPAVTHTQNTL